MAFSVIQRLPLPSMPTHVGRNWMRLTREKEGKKRRREDEKTREAKGSEERRREKRREEEWILRLNLTQHGKTHQVLTQ